VFNIAGNSFELALGLLSLGGWGGRVGGGRGEGGGGGEGFLEKPVEWAILKEAHR
jgi:hypothetical protein